MLVAASLNDEEGRPIPYTLRAKVESTVGQGTFVADEGARNSLVVWGASIAPGYRPIAPLMLSVYAKVIQEVTDSDVDATRQQLNLLDVNLRSDYALGVIPGTDIDVGTGLWLYLPTSRASQFETLMLGAAARLTAHWPLGEHFALDYLGIFRKNFHEYASPVVDAGGGPQPTALARRGGPEELGGTLVAVGVNNVSFFAYNLLAASWLPRRDLYVLLAYGITNQFTYTSYPRDALSSPYAEAGVGQRDSALGVVEVGYMLDQRFWFSAGITTIAAPKTEDNQSFRFPFYDFDAQARNFSLFYIDVTITEPIGG